MFEKVWGPFITFVKCMDLIAGHGIQMNEVAYQASWANHSSLCEDTVDYKSEKRCEKFCVYKTIL